MIKFIYVLKVLGKILTILLFAGAVISFYHLADLNSMLIWAAFIAFVFVWRHPKWGKFVYPVVFFMWIFVVIWVIRLEPATNRRWAQDKEFLPVVAINGSSVKIENIRNFKWQSNGTCDPIWESGVYNLDELRTLELVVEPFKDSELMAHTMVSFGFEGGRRLIVSVEARNEEDELYGLIPGALRQFELMYVFGSEEDLLVLRAVQRKANIYIYPVKADKEFVQKLFIELCDSANNLHKKPRFYRSVFDNCTTTLLKHIENNFPGRIGLRYETLFPAQTGKLLYEMGFMDTGLSYESAKERFKADERIRTYNGMADFSRLIRQI